MHDCAKDFTVAFNIISVDHLMCIILNRSEDGVQYSFEMESLMNYLKKMQAKASSPFYNVQVLKYEVRGYCLAINHSSYVCTYIGEC